VLRQSKEAWRSHVLYSFLSDVAEGDYATSAARYETFVGYVRRQQLEDAHVMVPILKGNEIKDALGGPKGGPWLKKAVDLLAEWQFNQPNAIREDAIGMIASRKAELGLG